MFISNAEKEEMRISIRTLQQKVKQLEDELIFKKFNETFGDESLFPIFTTADAPWGYKKNGMPKKRPGRPPQVMKVGQP